MLQKTNTDFLRAYANRLVPRWKEYYLKCYIYMCDCVSVFSFWRYVSIIQPPNQLTSNI